MKQKQSRRARLEHQRQIQSNRRRPNALCLRVLGSDGAWKEVATVRIPISFSDQYATIMAAQSQIQAKLDERKEINKKAALMFDFALGAPQTAKQADGSYVHTWNFSK